MNPPGRYRWLLVGLLWVVCVANYADRQALPAVLPAIRAELRFTIQQQGWILSAFMIAYAAFAPAAGMASDRLSRRRLIAGALLFWSLATMAVAACSTWWEVAAARVFAGLGETFYFPAAAALISAHHAGATRSRALAWHQSGVYAGSVAGAWLAAYLAETRGWRWGFILFGGAGVLWSGVLVRTLREPAAEAGRSPVARGSAWELLRNPAALRLAAAFAGANFVASMVLNWTPTYLADRFGLRLTSAGLNSSLYISLASAIAMPFAGWAADAWVARTPAGRVWAQACGVAAAGVFMVAFGRAPTLGWAMAAMAGLGFGKGFYDAGIFASLFDAIGPGGRATAAGWMNLAGWTGGAAAPAAAGWLVDHLQSGSLGEKLGLAMSIAAGGYVIALAGLASAGRLIERISPRSAA